MIDSMNVFSFEVISIAVLCGFILGYVAGFFVGIYIGYSLANKSKS